MDKVRIIEGVFKMRFEEVYQGFKHRGLTTEEAAEILGVSVRTFLRKRQRYDDPSFDDRFDLRLGKRSGRRAADNEVRRITNLYADKYRGFSVKHFWDFARREHSLTYGYTWTKKALEKVGLIKKGKRGGDHRLRRPRRPMTGMMLHQDGSTHEWILGSGQMMDLVVTLDDAASVITSAQFVEQEGTWSSFQGIQETIERYGLFCSLYTDRGSHYAYTPEAGGKVDKRVMTQVGRALKQLGISHIHAYSPQARGRSERMFGTLQNRLPQELALAGITTLEGANRYLKEIYIPRHNQQFSVKPTDPRSAYVPWGGMDLKEILCLQEERTVQQDNIVSYSNLKLQIPKDDLRHHSSRPP